MTPHGVHLMGLNWFRRAEYWKWTAREATDVIGAKTIDANDAIYVQAIAA